MTNFDSMFDINALRNDLAEMSKPKKTEKTEFKEVDFGSYEVKIDRLQLKESKAGNPMVTIWWKVIAGEFKDSIIFQNQVITKPFQIKIVLDLLNSLETGANVEFVSFSNLAEQLSIIESELVDAEFALDYTEGKNGFANFAVTERFC